MNHLDNDPYDGPPQRRPHKGQPDRRMADRRKDDRHRGCGLAARVVGQGDCLSVEDISIGGLRLIVPDDFEVWPGQTIDFQLHSQYWPDQKPVLARGEVRAAQKNWVALQFVRPSFDLVKLVSRHVSGMVWGSDPHGY